MRKDMVRQIGVFFATVMMLVVNISADIIPLIGLTTETITDRFKIYYVPASYSFLIWGVIYLGLFLYSIYQALPAQRSNDTLRSIGWWYIGSCFTLSMWMVFFHYRLYLFTMLSMVGLLVILVIIYERLDVGKSVVSRGMRFLVHAPFSIYLGWITNSAVANISYFLDQLKWDGFGMSPKIWAVVLIVITIVIAELIAFNRQDLVYLAVIVWAFIGIAVKNQGFSPVFEAASVAAITVVIISFVTLFLKTKTRKRELKI